MDIREDVDVGEIGTECDKPLELGGIGISMGRDDGDLRLNGWRAI